MNSSKLIGSTLIIIGTTIGAGMLALPIVSAEAGFTLATFMLVAIWVIMTITALLTLEVNLAFKEYANSLGTMATKTLGIWGKVTSWLCTLLILYSLTAAYIAGNASLLTNVVELIFHIKTPNALNALIYIVCIGGMVFWSIKSVDYCNRFFLSLKGLTLIAIFILLFPQINFANLIREVHPNTKHYLWSMLPIFLCSFGFHPIIPSLSIYIGRNPRELKFIIILGSSIALITYILWLFVTMGMIPWEGKQSFTSIIQDGKSLGAFIKTACIIANSKWLTMGINLFSNIAITTSFLGVTLGLFDFLADGFKRPNTTLGRFQTALLTFIPPLSFALFIPEGFILALNYAAFFATILVVILPALMAYSLRKSSTLNSPYRVFGGKYLLFFIILVGIFMLTIQLLLGLHIL